MQCDVQPRAYVYYYTIDIISIFMLCGYKVQAILGVAYPHARRLEYFGNSSLKISFIAVTYFRRRPYYKARRFDLRRQSRTKES